ncbi:MAG TPA: hypothetical protein DCS43_01905, partial [Verrucomicrobia bacterium]|nr:hypothetical protein [Verrucomicrobiota bacterium]
GGFSNRFRASEKITESIICGGGWRGCTLGSGHRRFRCHGGFRRHGGGFSNRFRASEKITECVICGGGW